VKITLPDLGGYLLIQIDLLRLYFLDEKQDIMTTIKFVDTLKAMLFQNALK